MIVMGVDPSVNNIGLALFDTDTQKLSLDEFHPKRNSQTPIALVGVQIARHILIAFLQGRKRPDKIIMEYPEFQGSERGLIAAQRGYTLDLAFIVGYLAGSLGIAASSVYTPTPSEWKYNLPKKAVGLRFERRFLVSTKGISDHKFEAAMMIDWYLKHHG